MKGDNKYKALLKNMGILTIGNFSSKILVFLLVPLYTSVLSTDEYGLYDLVITTIQLVLPIITANIAAGILRFTMDEGVDNDRVISIGIKWLIIGCSIAALSLTVMHFMTWFQSICGFEILIFGYFITYAINQMMVSYGKGLEKVSTIAVAGVISSIIVLGCNLLFLLVFKMGLYGFFLANFLGQAIPAVYYIITLPVIGHVKVYDTSKNKTRNGFWELDGEGALYEYETDLSKTDTGDSLEKQILAYSVPLIVVELGWWINNACDRYVVAGIIGTAATGLLSVGYKIPSIINVIQSIFIQAWHISGIKEYNAGLNNSFYVTIFRYLSLCMTGACSVLIMFSKMLGTILFAKDFFIAWQFTPFLLISSVINASSGFFGSISAAKKDSKTMAFSGICGAVVNLLLNIILVFLIGIQGATVATVISSAVIFLVRWRGSKDVMGIKDIRIGVISWLILVVQAVLAINEMVIMEILIMAILLWLYRKEILNVVRKAAFLTNNKQNLGG